MTSEAFFSRYSFNVRTDRIGGGSFGTVYKAYDNVLDREVAIKVSEVKQVGDKELSLQEEFKAVEELPVHPNIANYEAVFRFQERSGMFDYAVMQYYPLGNLSAYLSAHSPGQQEREQLALDILKGIAHLHRHKVVHRDLKPSNVLVVDRRGKLVPKITDFGLSKRSGSEGGKESRFTNSFADGTLQYSSPEQLKGERLRLNTDLWSFGVIAYEVITGKTLFEAADAGTGTAEWQNRITEKVLHQNIGAQVAELPDNWRPSILACLERDGKQRVRSAEELLALYKKGAGGGVAAASGNAATVALPGAKPPVASSGKKEDTAPKKASPSGKRRRAMPLVAGGLAAVLLGLAAFFWFRLGGFEAPPKPYMEDSLYGYKPGDSMLITAQYTAADSLQDEPATPSEESLAWKEAADQGTKPAYQAYLKNYPNGSYADRARKAIAEIEGAAERKAEAEAVERKKAAEAAESAAWKGAAARGTEAAYRSYLKDYPNGSYADRARNAIAEIEAAARRKKEAEREKSPKEYAELGMKHYRNKDYKEAAKWYRKAAEQGHTGAQNFLGDMYWRGIGVAKDAKESIKWYRKAAEQGNTFAQEILGHMYYSGKGVAQDYKEAIKWYRKAAKQGSGFAKDILKELGESW